jgi:hypothetical protein
MLNIALYLDEVFEDVAIVRRMILRFLKTVVGAQ